MEEIVVWNPLKYISWQLILATIGVLLLVAKAMKEIFGIDMIGRKIYKGAPVLWKWLMRSAIDRKELHNKLDKILQECSYNGGTSLKDAVRRIESANGIQLDILKDLVHKNAILSLRADINDITNDRMTFRLDGFGACVFINESFLKTFGYTERDIIGHNWESIVHDEDLEETLARWERAIKTKSRYFNEQRIWGSNGEIYDVRLVGYPIVKEDKLEGFYGTIDIIHKN